MPLPLATVNNVPVKGGWFSKIRDLERELTSKTQEHINIIDNYVREHNLKPGEFETQYKNWLL